MADPAHLHRHRDDDDGIRLDRWFKRQLARRQLQPRLALGADRAAARSTASAPRPATGSRPARRSACRRPRRCRRGRPSRSAKREPLTEDEAEFVREMVIHRRSAARSCVNKPPGLATQGGTKTHPASRPAARRPGRRGGGRGPSSSTGSTRTRRACCWSRARRGPRAIFAKAFSGRTARKVYWALVVGVPSLDDGMIDAAARQAAGHRRREDACRRGERAAGADPLPGDRPRRQSRRLGRAAAADRPHPPASRAHGGDRPSDRRRRANMAGRRPS